MANPALRPRFLAPGDKLGKFELIRQIAVGGMAELYLARTMGIEGFEKLVVVKRILPQYADNPSFVKMFLDEARLSATLHHPNIAQVYDIGVEDGEYFFSMEYIHGEDLGRLSVTAMENGVPMSLDAALTLVAGLCAGLHYAHEKAGADGIPLDVVHRDVSPSNVLVSYDGGVKLIDFGIARAGSSRASTRGGLKGKIAYMSPEQCRGQAALDRRSDLYSIGTILYELATGQLPFNAETEYGVLDQIVNRDAPAPSTLVPGFPPALEAIVMRALARDPAHRYATALELQAHIEDFAHENRLRVSPLVLVRLMSTLFPARLEEWDTARAQGGFFVEQHVVRTLIESGKTSDNTGVGAELVTGIAAAPADEETTAVTAVSPPPVQPFDDDDTGVATRPPVLTRAPTPVPPELPPAPTAPIRARTDPPVDHRAALPRAITPGPLPGAVPIVAAGTGILISNPVADAVPVGGSASIDVTERVRVSPSLSAGDETAFIRPPRKSRLPVFLAITAVIGVVAAVAIVMSDGSSPPAPAATSDDVPAADPRTAEPAIDPATVPALPPEPTEAATEAAIEAAPAPAPAAELAPRPEDARPEPAREPKLAKPETKRARRPRAKPTAPPKTDPQPKEPAWNDNSPFMPVRTGKP